MQREGSKPSWPVSLLWLAGLGVLFYASYGFSNWLASQRSGVPSIVFGWEHGIPFLAWTIVPYWTTNLFYAASVFLCRTSAEFSSHVRRLLTAQVISVACFILFSLKFSWPKPDTSGVFNFLYEGLALFDKPYNQAPSLHVALTVILAALYFKVLPKWSRIFFAAWSALVIVSVMTTYQHHFIDIPTGALLGLFCVWLWPTDGRLRVASWRRPQGRRAKLAGGYLIGATACVYAACALQGWFLWMLWPAFTLLAVSLAYIGLGAEVFDKNAGGRIGWSSRILLFPYLVVARINSRLWTRKDKKTVEIVDGVHLGRFPDKEDIAGFATVVDMTCEFSRPSTESDWVSFPVLDLTASAPALLVTAAQTIEQSRAKGPVLVVCALGYGRSVAALTVWLVRTGRASGVAVALRLLGEKRPRLALSREQMEAVTEAVHGR